ncbi:MAG TPA: DUF2103 domain-containing protein [Thermomicrobiaceae bacterium]|nr:DUF2103 domain-containing protein [Thermomicrobiaceae bacterium]
MRYREGILKVEHGILPGLKEVLLELSALDGVSSIVPGRIYATHARPGGSLLVRVTALTATGVKLIARRGSSVQEVFVVSDQAGEVEGALAQLAPPAPDRAHGAGGVRHGRGPNSRRS